MEIDCFQELLRATQMTYQVWETPCQHQQIKLASDLIRLLLLEQDQTSDVSDRKLQIFRTVSFDVIQTSAINNCPESRRLSVWLVENNRIFRHFVITMYWHQRVILPCSQVCAPLLNCRRWSGLSIIVSYKGNLENQFS